jgi:hypothetical protein
MTEQTEPDPYSIALRRLEKVLRETGGYVADMIVSESRASVFLRSYELSIDKARDTLPAAINAACDAVEAAVEAAEKGVRE